jgi:uncharacterized protein (TIGR00251 family)
MTVEAAGEVRVRVQPRARTNEIAGEREGILLVRVSAPPVEGRANEAVLRLIARSLRIARGRVSILRGEGSREKTVRVEGFSAGKLRSALLDCAKASDGVGSPQRKTRRENR